MMFKEIIAVYSENHAKPTHTNAALLTVKADGSYSYRSALKGQRQTYRSHIDSVLATNCKSAGTINRD
jgi:hypothetical protein